MKKASELQLKDYKQIRTPFVFFDETGSLNDKSNRYFGLGMIKCMQPHFLDSKIRLVRQQNHFYDEIKWNKISRKNLPLIKKFIDEVFITSGIKFGAIVINKDNVDFTSEYNNDPHLAYQDFTEKLLCKNISEREVLIVLADYMSTPNGIHFEVDLKHKINESLDRLAIAGVHRVESNGVNIIQIADLLLGAVIYEYKIKNKLVAGDKNKIKVYKYLLKKLNLTTFIGGTSTKNFKVMDHS